MRSPMEYQVTVEAVSEQLIAAARQRTTYKLISKQIGALLSHPWAFIKEHPDLRNDGHNVAIYWDQSGEASIEVGVQVGAPFADTDRVICSGNARGNGSQNRALRSVQRIVQSARGRAPLVPPEWVRNRHAVLGNLRRLERRPGKGSDGCTVSFDVITDRPAR